MGIRAEGEAMSVRRDKHGPRRHFPDEPRNAECSYREEYSPAMIAGPR